MMDRNERLDRLDTYIREWFACMTGRRVDCGARASVLREARALAPDDGSSSALRAFDALRVLLDRAAQGEEIEAAEWASSTSAVTSAIGSQPRHVDLVTCGAKEGLAAAAAFERWP